MSNLFEVASREKYRFPSVKGDLTTEQLWDLPLTSRSGSEFDLDTVAKTVNAELKSVTEESFVSMAASNPAKALLETKLEIVKHIIAVRLAWNEARLAETKRKAEKAKLLELIADKQDESLKSLSLEELTARAAAL